MAPRHVLRSLPGHVAFLLGTLVGTGVAVMAVYSFFYEGWGQPVTTAAAFLLPPVFLIAACAVAVRWPRAGGLLLLAGGLGAGAWWLWRQVASNGVTAIVLQTAMGCTWDGRSPHATCAQEPDKETPLWAPDQPPIYYQTSDTAGEQHALGVNYTGGVTPHRRISTGRGVGYRCVKAATSQATATAGLPDLDLLRSRLSLQSRVHEQTGLRISEGTFASPRTGPPGRAASSASR